VKERNIRERPNKRWRKMTGWTEENRTEAGVQSEGEDHQR
jgi:hypothetical protein